MTEADAKIPWLPSREAVARVARYLGCTLEDAKLRIVGKAGRVRARGFTPEGNSVSPLPASWRGIDWDAESLKPEITNAALCFQLSYEVTNVELCFADLVAADLLTTTALGRAWWSAAEALAWIIMGVPLASPEWAGLPELARHMKEAEIALGEAICEDRAAARGRSGRYEPVKQIPSDDLRSDMIEVKATPAGPWPKVIVTVFGTLAISPPQRGRYKGPPWESIEVDSATLRQAFPKPLRAERWPLIEAAPAEPPAESAKPAAVPHPGGRPPAVNWKMVDEEVFRLMEDNGEFSVDDPEWNTQARLEELIGDFCKDKFGYSPSETTIRDHIREP